MIAFRLIPAVWVYLLLFTVACGPGAGKPADGSNDSPPDTFPAPGSEPTEGASNEYLLRMYQKGVDFYAIGNEPFWSVTLDFEGSFAFRMMMGDSMFVPAVDPVLAQDARVRRYAAEVESGTLIVQLSETPCRDDMSGEAFPHTVTVDIKRGTDTDFTTYRGCGRYIPDFRLTDIWVLEELEGEKVEEGNFEKGLPRLEIDMGEGRVNGHDGCNNVSGRISTMGREIRIGPMRTTLMACPDLSLSDRVNQALETAAAYELTDNRLTLKKGPTVTAIWRKVD